MLIRPIEAQEIDSAADLILDAYLKPPSGDGTPLEVGSYAAELRAVDERARLAEVLVATEKGDLLGCVTYVDDPLSPFAEFDDADAAGIRMLAVAAHAQRRGVGTALIEACLEKARAGGKRLVLLHTTKWMKTAQRAYERLGFERAPQRDLFVPGLQLLAFELALDDRSPAGASHSTREGSRRDDESQSQGKGAS